MRRADGSVTVALGLTQCWHRVPGGTATSVLDLAAALVADDAVGVVGVGPRSNRPPGPEQPVWPMRHLRLGLPLLYDAWTWTGRPSIGRVVPEADLIHLSVPIVPPRERLPIVVTVHDVLPLTHPEWFTGRGAALMRRGLRAIARTAAAVIVPSEATRRACVDQGFDPAQLSVVPWGSQSVDATSEDQVARLRGRLGLSGPYVCFVGTPEPRKGLSVLIDALVRLGRPDVALALAGPPGWGEAGMDRLGEVPGAVVELGHLSRADLTILEAGAAAVVLPSLAEGFGLPVLESLAAGAVVITTSGTACGEVAGTAALLVPPGDHAALAVAIEQVLDSPELACDLRLRGPQRAADFSWRTTADATIAVYRSVLGGSTRGQS